MIKKTRSLIAIIQSGICFFMSLLLIAVGSLWLYEGNNHLQTHKESLRESSLNNQKKAIKNEVSQVIDHINYKREGLERRTKKQVQKQTEVAWQIAHYIYDQNKGKMSQEEIGKLIHDALYVVSWNEDNGYYFTQDMAGIQQVSPEHPELEGQSGIDLKDSNGKYWVKEIMAKARSKEQEGFVSSYWNDQEHPENPGSKISYIKYFEPLDWIIGNSRYLMDEKERLKQEIIEHIKELSLSTNRYLFAGTWEGVVLSGPGKGKNMWDIADANGVKIVQKLITEARDGGGFVHYVMPKLKGQRPAAKISYSAPVPDWHWYIGTGVYIDSIENEIARQQEGFSSSVRTFITQAALILALFLLISYLLIWLFARKIKNNFGVFIEFFERSAFAQLTIPPEKVSFLEFQALALSANQMVAERQQARKEKEKSEERFRQIVENINDVYFETSLEGLIIYCSPSCLEVSGYSQDELTGHNSSILYKNPRDRQLLLAPLQKNGRVRDLELLFLKKDGDLFYASFNADLALDEDGTPMGIKGTIRDVTTANKEKEQLQRSKKMEAIGLMAGGVAHDLNNILSGVVGYPEILLHKLPHNSELRKPIEAILESGQRAVTVVADLLTVARGAASIREAKDLNILVEEQLGSPESRELMLLHPDITCEPQFMATHPSVSCSPVHIRKCLMNLLINAAEAIAGTGTIVISTHNQHIDHITGIKQQMKTGDYVVLSVKDTGPGISDLDLKHIFEPFYTKKKMGRSGTGLGLAVVWNTMLDHKGKIVVNSSDKGTIFKLYFPVNKEPEDMQPENDITETLSGNGEHILIVDDESQLREIASLMLKNLGYKVDTVNSGEQAIDFAKNNSVDLIVLDMLMDPGINGRQSYEQIITIHPGQKAIIASGFAENDEVKNAIRLGVNGFINKPYSMEQLGKAVKDALKN